jgi:PmbA protein
MTMFDSTSPTEAKAIGLASMNLLDVCEVVVRRAQHRGATQVEVYGERVTALSSSLEQGTLKGAQSAEHEAFGVRVFVGDKVGFACVNRRDPKALDEAIDDAIAIARAGQSDVGNDLTDPVPVRPIYGLNDEAIRACTVEDAVNLAMKLLEAARDEDPRASVDSGSVGISFGETAIANSRGLRVADQDTAVSYGLFGMAVDGDEVSSFDHAFDACRFLADVDVDRVGRDFARRAVALLRPKTGIAYQGPVLFGPEAFEEIFLATILSAIDGDTVFKGRSRLQDKRGKPIAVPGFTLVDDGTLSGGIGSAHFDREGRPHRRTVLVGDGGLHRFLYDVRAARRAGTLPTGHAQGSARSMPSIGTTNLHLAAGTLSDAELLSGVGTGLHVTRFSGNVDDVSGDFSGVAKGSFLVRRGKQLGPVKETLVAGNVFDLLPRILGMGQTLHKNMATTSPAVLIDGVTVTIGADDSDD